jgi:uncharacterized protein
MFGDLDAEAIETVLHRQIIGHLGCHLNRTTYIVPISYAYEDGCIYGHTEEGMKINMMRQNSNVCFEVFRMENMGNWQCVIAWGIYQELTGSDERAAGLKILLKRELPVISSKTVQLTKNWPQVSEDVNSIGGIVFRINLNIKTGRYERTEEISY